MAIAFAGLKADQADAIPDVKLKHIATIVEGLIAVGSPHNALRPNHVTELRQRDTKMALLPLLSIERVAEGIGDLSRVWLGRKRHRVAALQGDAPFNLVVRAGQHRAFRRAPAVAAPASVNNEKAESTET